MTGDKGLNEVDAEVKLRESIPVGHVGLIITDPEGETHLKANWSSETSYKTDRQAMMALYQVRCGDIRTATFVERTEDDWYDFLTIHSD